MKADPALGTSLPGAAGYLLADVALACEEGMALELEDALSRRLRLSFLDVAAARAAAPQAARLMTARLGGDAARRQAGFDEHLVREFGALPVV